MTNSSEKKPYQKKHHYNLRKSFQFALEGLWFALRWERNLRIHLVVSTFVLYSAHTFYTLSKGEMGVLLLTIGLVLVCELLNTAIEKTVDLITPDYNALAKTAKDVAAGAVFVSSLLAVGVGISLFWDPPTFLLILEAVKKWWFFWIPAFIAAFLLIFLPEYYQRKKQTKNQ